MFAPSLNQMVKQAQQEIARHAQARQAPVVLWQHIGEALSSFDARLSAVRERLPARVALIAVCGPHPVPVDGVTLCEMTLPMLELLHPKRPARYRTGYGGRGAAKSWCFVRGLIVRTLERPLRVLCGRELQVSIQESVHRLLCDQIDTLGLGPWFDARQAEITGFNGSEFIFAGIRNNPTKIKSTEGIDIAFLEEAEKIGARSWEILIPTVRKPGSEIWPGFNPDQATDPTYQRMVVNPPPKSIVVKTSWRDNPWLSAELIAEKDYLQRVDMDAYMHVWEGECRGASDAQVLKGKWVVEAFEPAAGWDGPYYGADFGFAQDPSTCVKVWIHDRRLYVEQEAYGIGVDIDATPELFDRVPGARRGVVRADCARPETISYLQRHGYGAMQSVSKWTGSVEDGIQHLRSYEQIVIHPRCAHTIEECRLYSFKVDRLTNDVLPEPVDRHNHLIDAIRYALQPIIKSAGMGMLEYYRQLSEELKAGAA